MGAAYDRCPEFRDFVKSCICLAHIPLEDLEDTMKLLRTYKFTSTWTEEGSLEEFQEVLLDYIQEWLVKYTG